jgi:L-proline---[L-prolyl-carrier protein] ligase
VREPGSEITYRELAQLTKCIAWALLQRGVEPGDRVAIWLPKSTNAVAAMQAVLRIGAAYVSVDPLSPIPRARQIIADCEPSVCATEPERAAAGLSPAGPVRMLLLGEGARALDEPRPAAPLPAPSGTQDSLAYSPP